MESVYSMNGDSVYLEDLIALAGVSGAEVIIDEAHALGVIGKGGKGLSISLELQDKIFARIYTFGKALGVHGACICGSEDLKNYLLNFSRPFIYSTAMPEHNVISIHHAITYLEENNSHCQNLRNNITTFKSMSLPKTSLLSSDSAIQAIIIPGNDQVKKASLTLQDNGFDVRPILSPTVRVGEERLRICLHTYNSEQEISDFVNVINHL